MSVNKAINQFTTRIFNLQSFLSQSATFYHLSLLLRFKVTFDYSSASNDRIALLLSLQCFDKPYMNLWFHPFTIFISTF